MPKSSKTQQDELLKGTLEMLILKSLTLQPMHGYAIVQHIARLSNGVFAVEHGSLYPALARLQRNGARRSPASIACSRRSRA
jgi:PadR family transcriptional regulator, regulatory protein PadR